MFIPHQQYRLLDTVYDLVQTITQDKCQQSMLGFETSPCFQLTGIVFLLLQS